MTTTEKGDALEARVCAALKRAKKQTEDKISYKRKPKIILSGGELRVPDFQVEVSYPHKTQRILIECQDRKRTRNDILEKICYIRSNHRSQTFIFVYLRKISPTFSKRLTSRGITHRTLEEFRKFLLGEIETVGASWAKQKGLVSVSAKPSISRMVTAQQDRITAFDSHPDLPD
jgi:hypothetical protein